MYSCLPDAFRCQGKYIPCNLMKITNTTYTKCALRLIVAVWLCLLLFIYLHTINYIIVSIRSYSLRCYHTLELYFFLGGISIIFWYWIFILLKVLPSFTVSATCSHLFSKILFRLVVYPWHHVIILGQWPS